MCKAIKSHCNRLARERERERGLVQRANEFINYARIVSHLPSLNASDQVSRSAKDDDHHHHLQLEFVCEQIAPPSLTGNVGNLIVHKHRV